jgi:DNA-binding NtrC family response regulator
MCALDVTFHPLPLDAGSRMARILLVEDDTDVQIVVSEFLATIGHHVVAASSAEQARLMLAGERIDLALIDCLMSGEQGNSLAQYILQLEIPTILTSGDPHFIESLNETPLPFLAKPFRLSALEQVISQILRAAGEN